LKGQAINNRTIDTENLADEDIIVAAQILLHAWRTARIPTETMKTFLNGEPHKGFATLAGEIHVDKEVDGDFPPS